MVSSMSTKNTSASGMKKDKLDKRAAALRENLKKRKAPAKDKPKKTADPEGEQGKDNGSA